MNCVLAGLFFERLAIGVLHLDRMQRVETRSEHVQGRAQRAVNGCLAPPIAPTIAQVRRRMETAAERYDPSLTRFPVAFRTRWDHPPERESDAGLSSARANSPRMLGMGLMDASS
jgi:hypothetical protein